MKAPCHKHGIFPFILLAFIFAGRLGYGQNETKKWYFGNHAALDFNTNPPTVLNNCAMFAPFAAASISDANGNLLFYTNGDTVWNNNHNIMANGTGLNGYYSKCLISKKPSSQSIYYIFYLGSGNNNAPYVNYSIVDVSLAAGQGSVTSKNILLSSTGTNFNKGITATKHCNGNDIWIMSREVIWPFTNQIGLFRAFLLTSAGVNSIAVTSTANVVAGDSDAHTALKFSPNGKKLGVATWRGNESTNNNLFEMFDFDNSTGLLSNQLVLHPPLPINTYVALRVTACEFSPDGSKFYVSRQITGSFSPTNLYEAIYQWDLCAGSNAAIVASKTLIYTSTLTIQANNNQWYSYGSLQLATNGKLYVTKSSVQNTMLGVINNPNAAGLSCNYVDAQQSVGPNFCTISLPFFVSNNFYTAQPAPPFTFTINPQISCNTATFTSPSSGPANMCSSAGYSLIGQQWNFGDPNTGSSNTSTLSNPSHQFSSNGTFTTQLILYYSCGGGSDTIRQPVTVSGPSLTINTNSITCANLGSATVTPIGGNSPYSYTWIPTNQTNSVATGLSPGSYTVIFSSSGGNCILTNTTTFSPLIPLTASLVSTNSFQCFGNTTGTAAIINVAGGSANQLYTWSNGINSIGSMNFVNNLGAGNYSVTVTDALTGCQVFSVFSISQPPALTLNLSSGSPSICAGGSVVLSSTLSGGTPAYAYNWTGVANTDSFVLSTNSPASYVYTLNALDAYSCAVSNTIGVDVIINPVLVVPNVFICPLETGTLSVSGASSYTWSNNSVGNTFTDSPLSNSTYTVVGEALGCTNTAVASINLKSLPNPVLSSNSPVCESSTFSLSATAGTAYVWTGPGGFSSFASALSIPSVSLTQAGVYNLTVTAANACTASVSHTVVVKPLPTLTLSASAASICLGVNAATLSASGSGTLQQWYVLGSNTSFSNNALVQVSPTVSSTYSVNTYLNGCLRSASLSLSVIAPPSLSIALSSNSFCAQAFNGSPNTITLTSSGASSYTLSTPNHFSNANPSGPASPINLMPPYTNSGVATATLFGSNGVCTVSTTAQFSVVPNPTASVSNPTPVICAGQSYTYTSSGASSYVWSSSTPGSSLYTAGNVAVVNPSIQSVFSVYGSSVGCQSALQSYTLSVNPLPTVAVVPNPTYVCIGSPTELRAKSNGTSFVWYPQNITGSTILVAPTVKQQYTVVASLNNCTQSAVALVSVMPLPIARISNFSPSLCVNQAVSMLASGGISYEWKGPLGLAGQNAELSFVAFSKAFEGIYTVTVTDELGCKGSSQDTLRLLDLPTGNLLAGKEKACAPFTTGFVFDTGTKPNERVAGVDWYVNQRHVSAATSYSQAFVLAGNYSVQVQVKGVNGCVNTSSLLVTAYPKPKADFSYSPLLPVENLDEVVFENSSVGAQEFSWYIRLDYDKKLEYNGERVNYLFENPGLYPVVLLAKSEMGCSDTLIKTIKVEPDFAVYIPNAFTPNGDGKNEGFMPVMRGVRNFTLQIFNRWGQLLFESNTLNNTWDGNYRGVECKQDVYNYKLHVLTSQGEEKVYAGNVVLYR